MSNVTLSMLVTAKDDASGVFRRVGSAAGDVDKAHGRMARSAAVAKTAMAGLGIAAAGAAVYFAKDSVQAYASAEKAQLALQDAYKKYPSLAHANIAAIRSLNTELQAKTRFDDDDLALMQSRLAAFKLTGQQLREVTPLVADYAAKTGKDIVSAGSSVGKALLGNTRALKEIGISYTSTGNRAKDYANILGLLQKKVGGFATGADAKTAEATMLRLDHAFGEIQETVGKALLPYLTDLANWLTSNMPQIQSAVEDAMPQVRRAFETVGGAAKDVGGFLKGAWDAFDSMPDGVKKAAVDLTAVAVALGALKATGVTGGIKVAFDMGKSLFSAVRGMNVNAGVVNVNGKVGGVGANGAKFTGGTGAMLTGMSQGALAAAMNPFLAGLAAAILTKLNVDRAAAREASGDHRPAPEAGVGAPIATGSARFISDGNRAADAARRLEKAAAGAGDAVGKMNTALNAARGASDRASRTVSGLARSQSDYRRALGNSTKIARQNEAGIKGTTQAANRNRGALMQQAAAAQGLLANQRKMGASSQQVAKTQAQLGRQFVKTASAMGVPKGQAKELARAYGLLPPKKVTKVSADGAKQSKKDIDAHNKAAGQTPKRINTKTDAPGAEHSRALIDRVTSAARSLEGTYTANLQTSGADAAASDAYRAAQAAGSFAGDYIANLITRHTTQSSGGGPATHPGRRGNGPGQATGGQIRGPGTSTSDSIAAWLSNGEFVIRTQSAKAIGYDRLRYMNVTGQLPQFAGGGMPGDIINPATRRPYPWADERWRDYNPAPTVQPPGARPVKGSMPKKKKGEGDNAYQERVSDWRANYQERMADWRDAKNRYETAQRDRARTVAQGKLDYKWKVRDDAAAANQAARDAMKQAVNERIGRLSAGVGTGRAFASVTGFDLSSAASLQSEALLARQAVNTAGTPEERKVALANAAEADRKAAEAAPTANNVKKWLIKKRDQMSKFAEMLGGLKKKGVPAVMLAQVAQMDPESGLQVGGALADIGSDWLKAIQRNIDDAAASVALINDDATLSADASAARVVHNVLTAGSRTSKVHVQAVLKLDGKDIYTSMQRYQRQVGAR